MPKASDFSGKILVDLTASISLEQKTYSIRPTALPCEICGDHIILSQDEIHNSIPDIDRPVNPEPTVDDRILVKHNEVLGQGPNRDVSETNNVLMSHAGDDSLFNNKEVLAGKTVFLTVHIFLVCEEC